LLGVKGEILHLKTKGVGKYAKVNFLVVLRT